jgi:uncharacterized protein (DUF433 family)
MAHASIEHIEIDEKGVARIAGKGTKVIQIVMDKAAYGFTPEQIQAEHSYLSLAEVYAAFTYYYDHQDELDAAIEQEIKYVESMRNREGESPVVRKLRAAGKLP